MKAVLPICLALGLGTLALYSPVSQFDFINYDDPDYVTANRHARDGLSWQGLRWAFTTFHAGNWHPLTWLSHMADCQLFGLNPAAHHAVNALLHAASAVVLFLALRSMTGALWPSAFVAALFAWHPQRVESVAWVAERKDVLCALFWALSLLAYARYVKRPGAGAYGLVLLMATLGALAKPMIVTLPFVLLLLDFWPLRRWQIPSAGERPNALAPLLRELREPGSAVGRFVRSVGRLCLEKAPLFLISAGVGVATVLAQSGSGFVVSTDDSPLAGRLENAPVSYAAYILKTLWPGGLALPYPPRGDVPGWQVVLAVTALGAVTLMAVARVRQWPALFVGWAWFLGALVPVIGLVQVGGQSMADRYTYLPTIGLWIALVWPVADVLKPRPAWGRAAAIGALACALGFASLTVRQLMFWQDSETLFRRSLAVTHGNARAHFMLAVALQDQGRVAEAIQEYRNGLQIRPNDHLGHLNLAMALERIGRIEEAIRHYHATVELDPGLTEAWFQLGVLLASGGKSSAAIEAFKRVLELDPGNTAALMNLGTLRLDGGRPREAADLFARVVNTLPQLASAHHSLGVALWQGGAPREAIVHFREAIRLREDWPAPRTQLAWLLSTHPDASIRQGAEAVALAQEAAALTRGGDPHALDALGTALAEVGRFDEAIQAVEKAIQMARAAGLQAAEQRMKRHLAGYKEGRPVREP